MQITKATLITSIACRKIMHKLKYLKLLINKKSFKNVLKLLHIKTMDLKSSIIAVLPSQAKT